MPNPSELQRVWDEEEIERRSKQLGKMADSRQHIDLKDQFKRRLSKAEKEEILGHIRRLEKKLGITPRRYNGGM